MTSVLNSMGVFDAACALAESGVSVVFIRGDGSKAAAYRWEPDEHQVPSIERLRAVYKPERGYGLAMVGGAVSGNLEILDSDYVSTQDFLEACKQEGCDELLLWLPLYKTGSYLKHGGGGWQVCYRLPEPPSGNKKLAQRGTDVPEGTPGARTRGDGTFFKVETVMETRGEGGYAAIPPTPASCHEDNQPYRMLRGCLLSIPVITMEQREKLHYVASLFSTYIAPESVVRSSPPKPRARSTAGGVSPGDDYNDRGDYEGLLEAHRWTRMGFTGSVQKWQRPGKVGPGISATTGLNGERHFYPFSSSSAPFEEGKFYTPFAVYAVLECGGDYSRAASELAKQGYGTPLVREPSIRQPVAPEPVAEDVRTATAADADGSEVAQAPETRPAAFPAPNPGVPGCADAVSPPSDDCAVSAGVLHRAERSVLGAMISSADPMAAAAKLRLASDDFAAPMHRVIARALLQLRDAGVAVDALMVEDALRKSGDWDDMENPAEYLSGLAAGIRLDAFESHAGIVRDAAARRKAGAELSSLTELLSSGKTVAVDSIRACQERLSKLDADYSPRPGMKTGRTVVNELSDELEARAEDPEKYRPVSTGLTELDNLIGGFERGVVYGVAGRPSMGKSALCSPFTSSVCRKGLGVAMFTMETRDKGFMMRLACSESLVNQQRVKENVFAEGERDRFYDVLGKIHGWPLHVSDSSATTYLDIESRVKELKQEQDLFLVMVDYLQMLKGVRRYENRALELDDNAQSLARIAKEQNVAMVLLAQINRGVEGRGDKRPMLSDIRESGGVEAALDIGLFPYRLSYYAQKDGLTQNPPGYNEEAEIMCLKNRDGRTGSASVGFMADYAKFTDREIMRDDEPTGF